MLVDEIDVGSVRIPRDVLGLVPAAFARRAKVLPVSVSDDTVSVVMASPEDFETLDKLENMTGLIVSPIRCGDLTDLDLAIRRFYPRVDGDADGAEAVFDSVINRAVHMHGSDIHICPSADGGVVRMRIDGKMIEDRKLDRHAVAELTSFVKVMAGMDIAERRAPLDGSATLFSEGEEVHLRIATIPTAYGEHVTIRLLSKVMIEGLDSLSDLGMSAAHYALFRDALKYPSGMILLSGPTGSGKTTTLYASLRLFCEDTTRHVVTIEDPVEMPIPGATQVKVDSDGDRVSFAKALKSVLRHDPDVIMIGEIRDLETADIAVKSALTGHLVFSTLHTNSAAGILTRLVNLGVPAYLVAATIRIAVAQRLVRRPCPHCVGWHAPAPREVALLRAAAGIDAVERIPEARGCSLCASTGYLGRTAIYEMLPVDDNVKRMILDGAGEAELEAVVAADEVLPTLWEDGVAKILKGDTTLEEVEAACPALALGKQHGGEA